MCTLLFAYKIHPYYDFIFIGNRDEFKARPSMKAHFWTSYPNILAGKDMEKNGTWTGVSKEGKIAFITNYRDFSLNNDAPLSRGCLTRDFLAGATAPKEYLLSIQSKASMYKPFNLIIGTASELWYYSNIENSIRSLKPGIYGLSNSLLDIPWYKVEKAKKHFIHLLHRDFTVKDLFHILDDTEIPPDDDLPKTGIPIEMERLLSSIHIASPEYGTLYKTVILMDVKGKVDFYEKYLNPDNAWLSHSFTFDIHKSSFPHR